MRRSLNRFLCSTKACDLSTGCYCFDTCQCFWNSEEKESFWQLSRGRARLEPGKVDGVMGYLSSKRWGLGSILLMTWSPWTLQSSSIICEELFLGLEYWERMEQAGQPEGCCNNFPEESQTWLAIPMWRNACICPSHWCRLPIKTSKVSIRSSLRPTLAHDTLDHWSFSHSCGLHSCPTQERHTCYLCSCKTVSVFFRGLTPVHLTQPFSLHVTLASSWEISLVLQRAWLASAVCPRNTVVFAFTSAIVMLLINSIRAQWLIHLSHRPLSWSFMMSGTAAYPCWAQYLAHNQHK